jgi:hypothetical protein
VKPSATPYKNASGLEAGQTDVDHSRRVATIVRDQDGSPSGRGRWLHDVLEGTTITAQYLRLAQIPSLVIEAVEAVTKRDGEDLGNYAARIATNLIALTVKRVDLADNTDPGHLAMLEAEAWERLATKYAGMSWMLFQASAVQSGAPPSPVAPERVGPRKWAPAVLWLGASGLAVSVASSIDMR